MIILYNMNSILVLASPSFLNIQKSCSHRIHLSFYCLILRFFPIFFSRWIKSIFFLDWDPLSNNSSSDSIYAAIIWKLANLQITSWRLAFLWQSFITFFMITLRILFCFLFCWFLLKYIKEYHLNQQHP